MPPVYFPSRSRFAPNHSFPFLLREVKLLKTFIVQTMVLMSRELESVRVFLENTESQCPTEPCLICPSWHVSVSSWNGGRGICPFRSSDSRQLIPIIVVRPDGPVLTPPLQIRQTGRLHGFFSDWAKEHATV